MSIRARRARERRERRVSILDAAEAIFLDKGFAAARVEEIAAGADVSKGTVYLYFKSKDELYVAIILRILADLVDSYEEILGRGQTGLATMRLLGHRYVAFAAENRDRFRLSMSWLTGDFRVDPLTPNYEEYRALIGRLFGVALAAIERGKQDGTVRKDIDGPQLALQMWGSTLGMLLLSANREEVEKRLAGSLSIALDFDQLITAFIDRNLDGIKGVAP